MLFALKSKKCLEKPKKSVDKVRLECYSVFNKFGYSKLEINLNKGVCRVKFNHSKLLGRIRELGFTQKSLAESIGINKGTLSQKIRGNSKFTTEEITRICEILEIPSSEVGAYFFAK
jgi:DNA-binding Xre family transcriptional regulator